MSQLIAVRTGEGIALAADRRVEVHDGLSVSARAAQKLLPLGECGALASGGAAVGIAITHKLSLEFSARGRVPFEEMEARVLSVYQAEYAAFVERGKDWFAQNPQAHRRACFLLGGWDEDGHPQASFWASDDHTMPLTQIPFGAVLSMPRRLGLEAALARACAQGEGLNALYERIAAGFKRIEDAGEPVGGPYDVALLSRDGTRWEEVWRE